MSHPNPTFQGHTEEKSSARLPTRREPVFSGADIARGGIRGRNRAQIQSFRLLRGRLLFDVVQGAKSAINTNELSLQGLAGTLLEVTFPNITLCTQGMWWYAKSPTAVALPDEILKSNLMMTSPLQTRVILFALRHLQLSLQLFDTLETLQRGAELAKLYGTDIMQILSRGSQFQVEAMLSRAAHSLGYVLHTATKQQVYNQPASRCLPLVMEPESSFYWWPVAVLDFQSLYPSIMIAQNICYSTCLGQLYSLRNQLQHEEKNNCESTGEFKTDSHVTRLNLPKSTSLKLGVSVVEVPIQRLLQWQREINLSSENDPRRDTVEKCDASDTMNSAPADILKPGFHDPFCLNITPDSTMFVSRRIKRGVIPALLEEVLSTRILVKEGIKQIQEELGSGRLTSPEAIAKSEKALRQLNHRQFGLKMFANVTYGYTSASFTGRMPCAEIADSIIQSARRTLERSAAFIESHERWSARVVYGDTDSLFVHLPGRTLDEAFAIGSEIAREISKLNPWPLELKFEKVYFPCCLQTKKRYVGYAYERPGGAPTFNAKGIETIRRDQCSFVSTILRDGLVEAFESRDLSKVKIRLQSMWRKFWLGEPHWPLVDAIFLRRVKFGQYAFDRGQPLHTLPPQAYVSYALLEEWEGQSDANVMDSSRDEDASVPLQDSGCDDEDEAKDDFDCDDEVDFGGWTSLPARGDDYQSTSVKPRPAGGGLQYRYGTRVPFVMASAAGGAAARQIEMAVPSYRVWGGAAPQCPLSPCFPQGDRRSFERWTQVTRPLCRDLGSTWYLHKQVLPVLTRMFQLVGEPGLDLESCFAAKPLSIEEGVASRFERPLWSTYFSRRNGAEVDEPISVLHDSSVAGYADHGIFDLSSHSLEVGNSSNRRMGGRIATPVGVRSTNENISGADGGRLAQHVGYEGGMTVPAETTRNRGVVVDNTVAEPFFSTVRAEETSCEATNNGSNERKSSEASLKEAESSEGLLGPNDSIEPPLDPNHSYLPAMEADAKNEFGDAVTTVGIAPEVILRSPNSRLPRSNPIELGSSDGQVKPGARLGASSLPEPLAGYSRTTLLAMWPGSSCVVCGNRVESLKQRSETSGSGSSTSSGSPLCFKCSSNTAETVWTMETRVRIAEQRCHKVDLLCLNCAGDKFAAEACHDAFYCKVYTRRIAVRRELEVAVKDLNCVTALELF